jgi:hypothetical protein
MLLINANKHRFHHLDLSKKWLLEGRVTPRRWRSACKYWFLSNESWWSLCAQLGCCSSLLWILKSDMRSSGRVLSLHMEHSLSSEWLELNVLKMDELCWVWLTYSAIYSRIQHLSFVGLWSQISTSLLVACSFYCNSSVWSIQDLSGGFTITCMGDFLLILLWS